MSFSLCRGLTGNFWSPAETRELLKAVLSATGYILVQNPKGFIQGRDVYRCIKQSNGTDTHELSLKTKQFWFWTLQVVHMLHLRARFWKLLVLVILVARRGFTTVLILLSQPEQPLCSLFTLCSAFPQQEKLLGRLFGREGPRGSAAWEDASVRSAWVKGVHSMVHHQPALLFLCSTGELLPPPQICRVPALPGCCSVVKWARWEPLFKIKISCLSKTPKSLKDVG